MSNEAMAKPYDGDFSALFAAQPLPDLYRVCDPSGQPPLPAQSGVTTPVPIPEFSQPEAQWGFLNGDQVIPAMTANHGHSQYLAQTRPRSAPIPQTGITPRIPFFDGSITIDPTGASTNTHWGTQSDPSVPPSATQSLFDFNLAAQHHHPMSRSASAQDPQALPQIFCQLPVDGNSSAPQQIHNRPAGQQTHFQPSLMDPFSQMAPQQITPPHDKAPVKAKKSGSSGSKTKVSISDTPHPPHSAPFETPQWVHGQDYGFGNASDPNSSSAKLPRPSGPLSDSFRRAFDAHRTHGTPISPLNYGAEDHGLSAYRTKPEPGQYADEMRRRSKTSMEQEDAYPSRYDLDQIVHSYLESPPAPSRRSSEGSDCKKSPGQRAEARGKTILSRASYERLLAIAMAGRQNQSDSDMAEFRPWLKSGTLQVVVTGSEPVLLLGGKPIATVECFYDVLRYCHGVKGHTGRDKTHGEINKFFAGIPKEITAEFVKLCPTCRAKKTKTAGDQPEEILRMLQFAIVDPLQGRPKGKVTVEQAKAMAYCVQGYKPTAPAPRIPKSASKAALSGRLSSARKETRTVRSVASSSRPVHIPIDYGSNAYTGALELCTGAPHGVIGQAHQPAALAQATTCQNLSYDFCLASEMQRQGSAQSWASTIPDDNVAGPSQSYMSASASLESIHDQLPEVQVDDAWHREWVAQTTGQGSAPDAEDIQKMHFAQATAITSTSNVFALGHPPTTSGDHGRPASPTEPNPAPMPPLSDWQDWTGPSRNDSFMSGSSNTSSSPDDKGKGKGKAVESYFPDQPDQASGLNSAPSEDFSIDQAKSSLSHEEMRKGLSWLKAQADQNASNGSLHEDIWKTLAATQEADPEFWAAFEQHALGGQAHGSSGGQLD